VCSVTVRAINELLSLCSLVGIEFVSFKMTHFAFVYKGQIPYVIDFEPLLTNAKCVILNVTDSIEFLKFS
jgi:hypothetical protein